MGRALIRQYQGVDRRRRLIERAGFSPLALAPVSSWFRLAQGTIAGSGYSSVPDLLDPASPATQATDARRPTNQTSNNGLPIMTWSGNQVLAAPLTTARNGATHWGCAGWVRLANLTAVKTLVSIRDLTGGSSASKITVSADTATGRVVVFVASSDGRRGDSAAAFSAGTWAFMTCEYDADAATEAARATITVDGTVRALTFSNFGVGGVTGALATPTGNLLIGNQQDAGSSSNVWVGSLGPNLYLFGSKMAGATEGLLTAAARTALMNFEAPT